MKKIVAILLAVLMLSALSVSVFAAEEAGKDNVGYIFTDFHEITSVDELEVGESYVLTNQSLTSDEFLYGLPENSAYLYFGGTEYDKANFDNEAVRDAYLQSYINEYNEALAEKDEWIECLVEDEGMTVEEATAEFEAEVAEILEEYNMYVEDPSLYEEDFQEELDDLSYMIGSQAEFYAEGYDQGYVAVVLRGEGFDSCFMGAIGYLEAGLPIMVEDEETEDWVDAEVVEPGWFYACNGGGVAYVGPSHAYSVTCLTVTEDDIFVTVKDGVELAEGAVLTADQLDVVVNIDGREFIIKDFSLVNATITDGKIVINAAGVNKTVTIDLPEPEPEPQPEPKPEPAPKTGDASVAIIAIAAVAVVSMAAMMIIKKKLYTK